MKTIIISFLALTFFFAPVTSSAQYDRVEVYVDGLGCPFCAFGLEKRFKELKGISDIKIDMEKGLMTFRMEAQQHISLEVIDRQVDRAGYTLTDATITRHNGEIIQWKTEQTSNSEGLTSVGIPVSGNCGMCKARIERAALGMEGIRHAEWNSGEQQLYVYYDKDAPDLMELRKSIASSGHDTDQVKADIQVYNSLPACCLYRSK